jgi:hypothetical protein
MKIDFICDQMKASLFCSQTKFYLLNHLSIPLFDLELTVNTNVVNFKQINHKFKKKIPLEMFVHMKFRLLREVYKKSLMTKHSLVSVIG